MSNNKGSNRFFKDKKHIIPVVAAIVVVFFILLMVRMAWSIKSANSVLNSVNGQLNESAAMITELDAKVKYLEELNRSLEEENETLKQENAALKTGPVGFYQKLKSGRDVNILVVGDSIGGGAGSTEGNSWDALLKEWIEGTYYCKCNLTNISLGGNTSYAGYVSEMLLDDNIEYDLAVICYGENDGTSGFAREYEAIIRGLNRKYKNCALISILESSQKTYTRKIQDIISLAEHYDYPVADTIEAYERSGKSFEDLCVDDKHPNDEGYRLYFETISGIISEKCEAYEEHETKDTAPYDEAVTEYDTFYYIAASDCVRSDERTWDIDFNGKLSGKLGIDHELLPGGGELSVYADGELVAEETYEWDYDYALKAIHKIDDEVCTVNENMRLEFSSREMADAFKGLIFTGTD